jgi:hypothetical protein
MSGLCLSLLALAACEEIAVAGDPAALAEVRAQKSCIRAVEQHTKIDGGSINTTVPVVETGQYIIDLPNAPSWTCYVDANGNASQLIETRLGTSAA